MTPVTCNKKVRRYGSDRDKAALLRPRQVSGVCPGHYSPPARGGTDMLGSLEERLKVIPVASFYSLLFVFNVEYL